MTRRVRSSNNGHTERNLAVSSARLSMLSQHNNHQHRMLPLFIYAALVRVAAAPKITGGAESTNSLRWCSPMPKTSRPTWSARTISSSRLSMRWIGLTVRPVAGSEMTAPKLSIPICIFVTPDIRDPPTLSPGPESIRVALADALCKLFLSLKPVLEILSVCPPAFDIYFVCSQSHLFQRRAGGRGS